MIKKTNTLIAAVILLGTPTLHAQTESDFIELIQNSERLIENGLEEYQDFLSETGAEKLALVSQINQLENTLVQLRRTERTARSNVQRQTVDLETLNQRISNLDTQAQYSAGVLSEYLTNFESRIHVSEEPIYSKQLFEIRTQLDQAGEGSDERIPVFFKAIDAGLSRQESLIGGRYFHGRAITPDGGVKQGSIALIGPVAYFNADDKSANGILNFNSGTIEPGVSLLPEESAQTLANIFATKSGNLPLDPSEGKALILKKAKGSLVEHVQKGGWVGYTILALGLATILVALFKFFDLQRSKVGDPGNIGDIAKTAVSGKADDARALANKIKGPVSAMIITGIDFVRTDSETILESMDAVIMKFQPKLERFLPFLSTTAAIAPLMGLLGTVVGMIKTFTLIEVFGTGDAKSLSSGISEALITTELGLIVAIPALIFHGIFTRIMRSRIAAMEQAGTDFSRHAAAAKQTD